MVVTTSNASLQEAKDNGSLSFGGQPRLSIVRFCLRNKKKRQGSSTSSSGGFEKWGLVFCFVS